MSGDGFIAAVRDDGVVDTADPLEMDRYGHFKGCLSSGCGATRCSEARAIVPSERYQAKRWRWARTRGDV